MTAALGKESSLPMAASREAAWESTWRHRLGVVVAILLLGATLIAVSYMWHPGATHHEHSGLDLNLDAHAQLLRLKRMPALVHVHPGNSSASELLHRELSHVHAPVAVVLMDGAAPSRKDPSDPFLTLLNPEDIPLDVPVLNAAAASLEAAMGRELYPLTLQATDFSAHLSEEQLAGRVARPYVIWDASTGLVLMDTGLLQSSLAQGPVSYMAVLLGEHTFRHLAYLAEHVVKAGSALSGHLVVQLCAQAVAVAVPAAFAAAPPLWFCVLCPAVLGLVAPLIINFGLGEIASIICGRLQLTDEQCFDLMMGAIGLGFVLSLATAIPIFFVCRLMECAHRNATFARLFQS